MSNVSADLQALGFQSGINPGRMIRVIHTVVRSFATIVQVRPLKGCILRADAASPAPETASAWLSRIGAGSSTCMI